MARSPCPTQAELIAFLVGDLTNTSSVAAHLERCAACEAEAARLDQITGTIAAALRRLGESGVGETRLAQGPAARTEGGHGPAGTSTIVPAGLPAPAIGPPGYELLELLGRGGMGEVYKARHLRLNRLVALKAVWRVEADRADRFLVEAEAAARLRHPNIVQIHEIVEAEGRRYLALEYVGGGSLDRRLDGTPRPPRDSAELIRVLALAVQHAHGQGIIHRDLKPANVLLDDPVEPSSPGPAPKIADFGIARLTDTRDGPTRDGEILGTPAYMAPEQAAGQSERIGPATDVYSLGVILYELVTGRVPFRGLDTIDTLLMVRTQEPVPPRRLNPKVPRDLETICLKCLAKDPARRYATAGGLAEELGRWLDGRPIVARPVGPIGRLGLWARRRPAIAALAAALAVVAVAAFAAITVQWRQARANYIASEANLAVAREAIDQFTRFGDDRLLNQPHLVPIRREMLEAARVFYQRFADGHSGRPAFREDLARSLYNLGKIEGELGNPGPAIAHLERAAAICDALARASAPAFAAEYRALAARCEYQLGAMLMARDELGPARERLERALRRQQALADARPTPERLDDLSRTYDRLGKVSNRAGDHETAATLFADGLETCDRWARLAPDSEDVAYRRAGLLNGIARARVEGGSHAEGEALFHRALELLEALHREHPENASYAADVLAVSSNLGYMAQNVAPVDLERALAYYERSRSLIDRLVALYSSVAEHWERLGILYGNLGNVYARLGRADEARALYLSGQDRLRERVRLHPDQPVFHDLLGLLTHHLGRLDEELGDLAGAIVRYAEMERIFREVSRAAPDRPLYRSEYATALQNVAWVALRLGRHDEAGRAARGSVAEFEALIRNDAETIEPVVGLGVSLELLGRHHERGGRAQPARSAFQRATATLGSVLDGTGRDRAESRQIRRALSARASAFQALGQPGEALADWDALLGLGDPDVPPGPTRVQRARSLAHLGRIEEAVTEVEAVLAGHAPSSALLELAARALAVASDRADGVGSGALADRALDLLARASQLGPFPTSADLREDPDFRPLAGRPEFAALRLDAALPAWPFARSDHEPNDTHAPEPSPAAGLPSRAAGQTADD
jgi:tetratricopeptide (TPR) repeat protein/tRNA A-37 threonylcarbamoyl transferase component Bud32